jgi:hypothetical protein
LIAKAVQSELAEFSFSRIRIWKIIKEGHWWFAMVTCTKESS